jgi:hypothetical protein
MTIGGTGSSTKTDLYSLSGYVQNSMISYPKEIFIETLKEFFSQDSYYHYQRDEWGFAKVTNHLDQESDAGINDDVTSRLFVGESFRKDVIYYPAILVRNSGSRSVPISMNRDRDSIIYSPVLYIDGYGNQTVINTPSKFVFNGSWEGAINVEINTRSSKARDELVDLVSVLFVDLRFDEMKNAGILIKGCSVSGPSEADDRNDKLFKQTITFDIRGEWSRQIPILNLVDKINFCVDFGDLATENYAPNISVSTMIEVIDQFTDL